MKLEKLTGFKQSYLKALNIIFPDAAVEKTYKLLSVIAFVIAMLALLDLAIRAGMRIEAHWDTVWYHLPFAALRGGLNIPYEMNDLMMLRYQGFPFLPHLVQGLFWKITGSVNATGVVNYLAFLIFLAFCHLALRASFWLVALIALTAPMVLIHATTSYVDLFGNSFLAIGISSCLFMYLFPERVTRTHIFGGLAGLIAAAWSKYLIVPVVVLGFLWFTLACFGACSRAVGFSKRQLALIIWGAVLLAALPYLKNMVYYANPFWPVRVPVFTSWFPYLEGWDDHIEKPPPLQDYPQFKLFLHSLFEINHPTHYEDRERWVIDQGSAWIAFRMGGFWFVGVIFYLLTTVFMLLVNDIKTGVKASLFIIGTLCFVAVLPQSNELRYFLFIPLSWAASCGMLFSRFKQKLPRLSSAFLIAVLGLFAYMAKVNWPYYRIEKIDYEKMATQEWAVTQWWPKLKAGQVYCAVNMLPIGILLTGPTMSEFTIVDRTKVELCPTGSSIITRDGIQDAQSFMDESFKLYNAGKYQESINQSMIALHLKPDYPEVYNNICIANINLQRFDEAIKACSKALELRPDLNRARNNLVWALQLWQDKVSGKH